MTSEMLNGAEGALQALPSISADLRNVFVNAWNIEKSVHIVNASTSLQLQENEEILCQAVPCCYVSQTPNFSNQKIMDICVTNQRICLPQALHVPVVQTEFFGKNNLWFGREAHGSQIDKNAGFFALAAQMLKNDGMNSNIEIFQLRHENDGSETGVDVLHIAYAYEGVPVFLKLYHPQATQIYEAIVKVYPTYT